VEGKLEFLFALAIQHLYNIPPRATLLLHCIAIPPAALQLASYYKQYPERVTQNESGCLLYASFKFSNGWFQGYRRRWCISNRCWTKTAQQPLENSQEKVTAWLQFNRRQTVIIKDFSDVGLPRGKDVPVVGWFKLSEIGNMDQTPLAFDFLSSRTYNEKGASTVWLKESRSGWDKR
jgi:hypothetical protein